jgi:hypothetical protein
MWSPSLELGVIMTAHSSVDRESFQSLLACAFAVQESGMNKQSLSAQIEIYKAIANEELPFEKILDLIADRAQSVADATGVAVRLLTGDQLVYRAGSGSGAQHIGQHVTAVLSVPGHTGPRKEILRVDDAENDPRIEAVICRECAAKALLILPIYRDHFVAGVLEVLFADAHNFDDGEMRSYRMMANLVEEAMACDLQHSQQRKPPTQSATTTESPLEKTPFQIQDLNNDQTASNASVIHVCSPVAAVPGMPVTHGQAANEAATVKWLRTRAAFRMAHRSLDAFVVVIVLGLAAWISLDQHAAWTVEGGPLTSINASGEYQSSMAVNDLPHTSPGTHKTRTTRPQFRRVTVGPNEVDYVAEDVTIRTFTRPVLPSPLYSGYKRLNTGDAVTVRVFKGTVDVLPQNSRRQDGHTP